jgi:CHAT domain-containing protein/tetratricopeptide (TPR) repeat protein
MRSQLIAGLLSMWAAILVAQQQVSVASLYQKAKVAEAAGHWQDALADYSAAIQIDDRWEFRLQRGFAYLRLHDPQSAADDFAYAAEHTPADTVEHKYFKAIALSNEVLAQENIRKQLHPDLERYEEVATIAREIMGDPQADQKHIAAAEHLIGTTLVLEGILLESQNQRVDAIAKVRDAIPLLPEGDHHWRAQAFDLAGELMVDGPAWQQGLEFLYRAVEEAQNDAVERAKALYAIVGAERDHAKRMQALQQLAEVSFEGLPDEDYQNAWRSVHLAGAYLADAGNPASAGIEVDRVRQRGWAAKYPDLRYSFLFARANLATFQSDHLEILRSISEAETILAAAKVGSTDYLETSILLMRLYAANDDFKRALTMGEQAQKAVFGALGESPKDIAAFSTRDLVFVLHSMAEIYRDLGRLPDGLELVRRSISLYEELKMTREATAAQLEYALFWAAIDPKGAEDKQHIPEWRRTLDKLAPQVGSFDPELKNAYHRVYALALVSAGQLEAAASHVAAVDRTALDSASQAQMSLFDAELAFSRHHYSETSDALMKVNTSTVLSPLERTEYYDLLGAVTQQRGDLAKALEARRTSLAISDLISAESPEVAFQADFRDSHARSYDAAIQIACKLAVRNAAKYDPILLDLVLNAIIPAYPVGRTPMTPQLNRSLTSLAVIRVVLQRWPEFQQSHPGLDLTDADLRSGFRRDYTLYFSQLPESGEVRSDRAARVKRFLTERSRAPDLQIRVYYLGESVGVIFTFQGGAVHREAILSEASVRQLNAQGNAWREAITQLRDLEDGERQHARELTPLLFPDGWQRTPPRIEIVAHGPLWEIPVETLVTSGKGSELRYLDEDRSVTYWTPISLSRAGALGSASRQGKASFGYFFLSPDLTGWDLDPFPDPSGQAIELEKNGIPRQQILMGKQATEVRTYGAEISKAPWIHYTTHTAVENPWEQHVGLVLTANPGVPKARMEYSSKTRGFTFDHDINFQSDGFLSPREIETLKLNAEFVFLQGCQTVTGRLSFSSGLLGLMSAFLTAGAQSVVASHWEVGARPEINHEIAEFYARRLQAPQSVEVSLREMRSRLRRQEGIGSRPYAWGAFSMYR